MNKPIYSTITKSLTINNSTYPCSSIDSANDICDDYYGSPFNYTLTIITMTERNQDKKYNDGWR